jgi:phosphoribosylanthranilate isomerase
MSDICIKICGLSEPDTLEAALTAGADMIGLVSFPKSPRHVDVDAMAQLAEQARGRAQIVILTVNADDALLAALNKKIHPDWWQFHGQEDTARIETVQARFGRPVMKAVGVGSREDAALANRFAMVADRLLLDAKPPKDATRPGGLGEVFDWTILQSLDPSVAFMLSGGLTPANVADALAQTHASGVDVSSGVESAPGVKDKALIEAFIATVRGVTDRPERIAP